MRPAANNAAMILGMGRGRQAILNRFYTLGVDMVQAITGTEHTPNTRRSEMQILDALNRILNTWSAPGQGKQVDLSCTIRPE